MSTPPPPAKQNAEKEVFDFLKHDGGRGGGDGPRRRRGEEEGEREKNAVRTAVRADEGSHGLSDLRDRRQCASAGSQ